MAILDFLSHRRKAAGLRSPDVQPSPRVSDIPEGFKQVESGVTLLERGTRASQVTKIKRMHAVTNEVWQRHYLYAIRAFAELVQEHPASRNNHHSTGGGLLDHTLDTLLKSMKLAEGYILPPNSEPEDIQPNAARWRYGIFIAALLHDVGKLITDQETAHLVKGDVSRWVPWNGPMQPGTFYTHRYRQTKGEHYNGLHERAGITLLPYLTTRKGAEWLMSDRRLMSEILAFLSAAPVGGGVVGEIVKKADQASARANNLGVSIEEVNELPLHEILLGTIQTLANEGKIARNRPGANCWVLDSLTWFSATPVLTAARQHMIDEGHTGIPQSPRRLNEILNENSVTITPPDGGVIIEAMVTDTKKSWKTKTPLSFFVIENEKIWTSGVPTLFNGSIQALDAAGNPVTISPRTQEPPQPANGSNSGQSTESENSAKTSTATQSTSVPVEASGAPADSPFSWEEPEAESQDDGTYAEYAAQTEAESSGSPQSEATAANPAEPTPPTKRRKKGIAFRNLDTTDLAQNSDFFKWLINGVIYKRIKININGAPVHIIGDELALVSPRVFTMYLADNKAAAMSFGFSEKEQIAGLQKSIKKLNKHRRTTAQADFHRISVKGPNRESTFSAMMFDRKLAPALADFSPNPVLELHD